MKCQICGIEVTLPYNCPYCGGQFCSQHRLPENHTCPQISRARTQSQYTAKEVITQTGSGYNYSFNFNSQPTKTRRRSAFSSKELKHISIAALLVMGIGISIGLYVNFGAGYAVWTKGMIAVFSVCILSSFLVHELAHKFTAQKRGLWAEFRLTITGALLTFISVFVPFKVIAPGAMMISGTSDRRGILKISIAGPITNIIFAAVFYAVAFTLPLTNYSYIFMVIGFVNSFMAVFNLIPFGVFDGYKIFSVDKKAWAIIFIPSVILTIFGYLLWSGF